MIPARLGSRALFAITGMASRVPPEAFGFIDSGQIAPISLSLFIDDGRLAVLSLALIAAVVVLLKLLAVPAIWGGIVLLAGCLLLLAESVGRASRRRCEGRRNLGKT